MSDALVRMAAAIFSPQSQPDNATEIEFADVHVSGEEFVIKYSDDAPISGAVKPKVIRVQGRINGDPDYWMLALPETANRNKEAELQAAAARSEALDLSVFDSRMNLYTLLRNFPTNFAYVSIAFLEDRGVPGVEDLQSLPLYEYIGQLVASREVKYFNLIGDASRVLYDALIHELMTQDQVKEVFVHIKNGIRDEEGFLHRLLLAWINGEPWKTRSLEIAVRSRFEEFDFIRELPKSFSRSTDGTVRQINVLSHPCNPERKAHLSRNHIQMLTIEFK